MDTTHQPFRIERRYGLGATVAIHLALLGAWQLARQAPPAEPEAPRSAVQWLWLRPPPVPAKPLALPAPRPGAAAAGERRQPVAPQAVAVAPPPAAAAETSPPAPATPSRSVEDMMQQARRDVGAIDRDLRKAARGLIPAPADSAQIRLAKGIAQAADLAPGKWYEAPKVTEIIDPGGYGRRRYRVVGALSTYCITYESNHAPDGIDTMRNGIKPKITGLRCR